MTCRFFAALAVLLGLLLASVASMAQEKSPKSTIDDVVKQCVDVVHRFPADNSDLSFLRNSMPSTIPRLAASRTMPFSTAISRHSTSSTSAWHRKGSPSSDRTNVFGLKPRSHKRAASYPLRSCRHLRSPTKPAQRHSGQAVFPRRWRVATPRRITFDRIKADFCAWSKCRAEHSFPLMISAGAKIPH